MVKEVFFFCMMFELVNEGFINWNFLCIVEWLKVGWCLIYFFNVNLNESESLC